MFRHMVGVWLVRQGSSVLWKTFEFDAGGSVVLEGWVTVLCGCGFEGWLSVLCGRGGHVLFESLLHILCGCGGVSFRNSGDRLSGWVFRRLKSRFVVWICFIFIFVSIFVFVLFC